MLERYLSDVVTRHFGHVIANLDHDKVRWSAWNGGTLVLEDVELRREALDHYYNDSSGGNGNNNNTMPIEIAHGRVGRLEIRIPWKVVRAQLLFAASSSSTTESSSSSSSATDPAMTVQLSNVNILITPRKQQQQRRSNDNTKNQKGEDDDGSVSQRQHGGSSSSSDEEGSTCTTTARHDDNNDSDHAVDSARQQQMAQDAMDQELLHRVATSSQPLQQPEDEAVAAVTHTWKWKLQERAKAILSNLSVTIQNIHIRYEDPGTSLGFKWSVTEAFVASSSSSCADSMGGLLPTPSTTQLPPPIVRFRPSFAIGVTLEQFTVQTAEDAPPSTASSTTTTSGDDASAPAAAAASSLFQKKVAAASQLAVYWDSNVEIMSECAVETADRYERIFAFFKTGNVSDSDNSTDSAFQRKHSFILDPFSPSIQFGLASATGASSSYSTIDLALPPCRFTLSRSILEDLGYLRQSMAVWMHAKKGLLLPEETLRMLTSLRPAESASTDPRGWWLYAFAAVRALNQRSNNSGVESRRREEGRSAVNFVSASERQTGPRRRKGWIGLAQALGRRRRYVDLYAAFLRSKDKEKDRSSAHEALLLLEQELLISEIVAFRIAAYHKLRNEERSWSWISAQKIASALLDQNDSVNNGVVPDDTVSPLDANNPSQILSVEHRAQMFLEMAVALNREQRNLELQRHIFGTRNISPNLNDEKQRLTAEGIAVRDIAWKTSLKCSELSFQVNDSRLLSNHSGSTSAAVVRLCCAFAQEQELNRDGSWEMTNRIGSLVVKDCTGSPGVRADSAASQNCFECVFPNLIGPKGGNLCLVSDDDNFLIDGTSHPQTIWINIHRAKMWNRSGQLGSTTTTRVRVLPLEIVYATAPVESLSHVMNTADLGLGDDYNRIASRMSAWRERQQNRLLRALAHKQKKINVDVVVGAPVLLLPESRHPSSPLMIIDLGRLRFFNDTSCEDIRKSEFDDKWKLELTDIQIQSSSTSTFRGLTIDDVIDDTKRKADQQLIEPFSLQFSVSTKFHVEGISEGQTSICVHATLPRMVINLTSSAVRLLRRLDKQWKRRRKERRPSAIAPSIPRGTKDHLSPRENCKAAAGAGNLSNDRRLEFQFVAPLFSIKFENDDGHMVRRDKLHDSSVSLFDLALRGIEGRFVRRSWVGSTSTSFSAKVRTLRVVDLYQDAGDDFSFLLSSVSPEFIGSDSIFFENHLSGTHLVSFEYKSLDRSEEVSSSAERLRPFSPDTDEVDLLSIEFNELYVEWNPETIAAISLAVVLPIEANSNVNEEDHVPLDVSLLSEDRFFDAQEDAFFDAKSVGPDHLDGSSRLLSEISVSDESSCDDVGDHAETEIPVSWKGVQSPLPRVALASAVYGSPWSCQNDEICDVPPKAISARKPFEVAFRLSKLRVNFNKESRHRRLMTAEMDGTSIRYRTMQVAGSRTLVTIGNLTFADSESQNCKTLYREILGLKTDAYLGDSDGSSLLEMEMIIKPRSRQYVSLDHKTDDPESQVTAPVSVDLSRGMIHGFDKFLRARFSPMRFVYLQQLWFEIVDYFFAGIIGDEVWGGTTPTTGDIKMLEGESVKAESLSFTRFDVELDAPVIMLPVSSCSTDFIRLEASSISFRNHYTYEELRPPTLRFCGDGGSRQWYNNCIIKINAITLRSWSGKTLNQTGSQPSAHFNLNWPVGPSAPVNVPKWKVGCSFDALHLDLDRPDYALLQHVVQYNFGDESHHLDEWYALKSLPSKNLQHYMESILVHYGYDKKDSTPSTFDAEVRVPLIAFSLKHGKQEEIAVIGCSKVCWHYRKSTDRVSRQRVACDIDIIGSSIGMPILSSFQQLGQFETSQPPIPALTYTTTTDPSGNNKKALEVVDALVVVIYPAWKKLSAFFQSLPEPSYLSPDEAIQVGDRWYRISESPKISVNPSLRRFRWIEDYSSSNGLPIIAGNGDLVPPSYEFNCSFLRPCIRLGSGDRSLELSIENFDLLHNGKNNLIRRRVRVLGIEVQTRGTNQKKRSSDFSLIRPWSVTATMEGCSGRFQCCCESHPFRVSADSLHARLAFSDLTVALDAGMHFVRDVQESKAESKSVVPQPSPSNSTDERSFEPTDDIGVPKHRGLHFEWKGLHIVVADDSGRHFAGDQDLIVLLVEGVNILRDEAKGSDSLGNLTPLEYKMSMSVQSLDLIDCLQSSISPFRELLRIRSIPVGFSDAKRDRDSSGSKEPIPFANLAVPCPTDSSVGCPAVELWSDVNESRVYGVDLRSLEVQYNPSVVVALQRFLGRLWKEAKKRHADILERPGAHESKENAASRVPLKMAQFTATRGSVDLRFISLRLNKEHQRRCLLEVVFSRSHMELEWNDVGSCIAGHIKSMEADDPAGRQIGSVAKVVRSAFTAENFIAFRYKTFTKPMLMPDFSIEDIPPWIVDHLDATRTIDDFLDISVSPVEVVFVRDRTEEILDYLSNGMPGKGMGATSRAAKGFVNDRIQKRSFLNIQIDSPMFTIPRDRTSESSLSLCLAKCKLNSWIVNSIHMAESQRMLSFHLLGLSIDMNRNVKAGKRTKSQVLSDINFLVDISVATSASTIACRLSDVVIRLSYLDYLAFRYILCDNIGRKVDKSKWDNLEVAWEKETGIGSQEVEKQTFSNEVLYSTSARLVRYGQGEKSSLKKPSVSVNLHFESLSVLLRRDDVSNFPAALYDLVLARMQGFELGLGRKEDGDQWLNASLQQVFVFDLGRVGRRELRSPGKSLDALQAEDFITVLLQGYSSPNQREKGSSFDSQIVVKVDREAPPSGLTKVVVVVSFLSIAPMVGPIRDVVDFITCEWGESACLDSDTRSTESLVRDSEKGSESKTTPSESPKTAYQRVLRVQFVSHYPRLVFAADENDVQSKALVLHGLSIANMCFQQNALSGLEMKQGEKLSEITVTADFQDVSSYMIPDICDIIAIEEPHSAMLKNVLSCAVPLPSNDHRRGFSLEDIGVPVLLPLTVSIEFDEKRRSKAPKERSVGVNIDPLSVLLSHEDLELVQSVVHSWTSKPRKSKRKQRRYLFDATFHSKRLGLGLRKQKGQIVVDNKGDSTDLERILNGDALYAINGQIICDAEEITLSEMVHRLSAEPRPLRVTFLRYVDSNMELQDSEAKSLPESMVGTVDNVDIALAKAVVTMMEHDVPLFRGSVSSSKIACRLMRSEGTNVSFDLSTSVGIDFYNLRIWGWEPFIEPGIIVVSSTFQETFDGPRELAFEIGDRGSGLFVNITDSLGETVSKLLEWGKDQVDDVNIDEYIMNENADLDRSFSVANDIVSRKAANVALRFATRQKNDSAKPFIFRNKTGLSVAFAQHNCRTGILHMRTKQNLADAVGDYKGLSSFDPSEIMVVANDEEIKFRVDIVSDNSEGGVSKFPTLTISLQETDGITADPFERLPINRPGMSLFPLSYSKRYDGALRTIGAGRQWVTWLVEHVNEKTVVTLGSSVRVASVLEVSILLGIEVNVAEEDILDPKKVMPIGSVRIGSPFYLPLWIAMQQSPCRCSVKLHGGYQFTPLFYISTDGSVRLAATVSSCIECISTKAEDGRSAWLTISSVRDSGIEIINIDCSISLRNLLPSSIDWEIGDNSSDSTDIIDGTTMRRTQPLRSGKQAEILSKGWYLKKIRLRPSFESRWSAWTPLILAIPPISPRRMNDNEREHAAEESGVTVLRLVSVKDGMNTPLSMGLRIAQKSGGLDVTVFTELWCTNCTPLSVVFGCPKKQIMEADDSDGKEFSAAEATLNEISALFESGDTGAGLSQSDKRASELSIDVIRLPGQVAPYIVEECFEYLEVEGLNVRRRWWAGEEALSPRVNVSVNDRLQEEFEWIDKNWKIDVSGNSRDGWESAPNLSLFSPRREFYPSHRYRRRRWTRTRKGLPRGTLLNGVDAFFQPVALSKEGLRREKSRRQIGIQVAVQVGGGKWSSTAVLPSQGTVYGVLRAFNARWPEAPRSNDDIGNAGIYQRYELCYAISPLDGDWGLLTRSMLVSSRFLLRNDSSLLVFEVKQTGADDLTSVQISPGETAPYHWGDFRLPELVCIRPVSNIQGRCIYKWSGGFDPLTIGLVPIRTRIIGEHKKHLRGPENSFISAVKVDVEIRAKSGGTGINLSFKEENNSGEGALYRIENYSPLPIWVCQDDVLFNPVSGGGDEDQGDYLGPFQSLAFALDVPYKQGKYSHRKAASMDILLRARLALAPLSSRAGIETTKVVSLTTQGGRVRLNPSKLMMLDSSLRASLQHVRVIGVIHNDGPTRVLTLRLMKNELLDRDSATAASSTEDLGRYQTLFYEAILNGATNAAEQHRRKELLSEDEVVKAISVNDVSREEKQTSPVRESSGKVKNLIVSFRAAFSGLAVSLVDSAPSEIALVTLKNMNAIATWDTLRNTDSTIYITVTGLQVDNMVPNAPFPVAVCPFELQRALSINEGIDANNGAEAVPPLLVIGLSFAPRHKSGIVCLKSATIAPRNLAIKVDLAFLVRLQMFALDMQEHFQEDRGQETEMAVPDMKSRMAVLDAAAASGVGRQKIYFGGLTILPCNIKLSVAPARALTPTQALLEGEEAAAIHQAVRKGDVLLNRKHAGILGVKIGSRNKTPLAVVRGMFKSFVVDGLLRLDGASLNFAGVSLSNYTSTGPQLTTALGAHYFASLRQNLPAMLGSMAALGNPLGLVRGLGEGVGDFVLEPVRGFQRSVQEMDASYLVDGVARGTLSLARHTVGGFADSAAMLAETFSKNMTVLTLDRRYAQKRDRGDMLREQDDINVASGLGSGVQKLVLGFLDGVTGVVRDPIRGAEKRGLEGFAKGIGKGLLGLLVKPIIGISDGFTDVMIGVKGTVDFAGGHERQLTQVRPRRALYGREKAIRPYHFADAAASALMLRTRLAGEPYFNHVDMGDRVALLSVKRLLILGRRGEELLILKFKHIDSVEVRSVSLDDNNASWGIIVLLNTPRSNGSEVEVIACKEKSHAEELCALLEQGKKMSMADSVVQQSLFVNK